MAASDNKPRLKKELGLLGLYALATGATLSSGFFLLPGLAFKEAGPAMIVSYIIAVIPLVPAMFSIVELGSAMPRAGGAYYFLDRTLGPLVGTIGGLGTWLALTLKTAFALIGMGAYLNLYLPNLPVIPAAMAFAVIFAISNLFGTAKAGSIQVILVGGLLAILFGFIGHGLLRINPSHLEGFFSAGSESIIGTAGLVYISYIGVTKVASVSEEVKDPERTLPLGVFMAMGTAVILYGLGTTVIVGLVPPEALADDLRPVATAAGILAGSWGAALATIAALCAFFAVANAGILSASRYPLAMSRDHLLPGFMRKLNARGIPANGVFCTLALMLVVILLLDPTRIAKLASGFQLLVFALICLAVILMRESGLESYDPGFRSPWYPWMQISGIALPGLLLMKMGTLPILFCMGLIIGGTAWYRHYARDKIVRHGAIFHVFERLGQRRYAGLDVELRGIMKEKGLRAEDPYDDVIITADVLEAPDDADFERLSRMAARLLAERMLTSEDLLLTGFLAGTRVGATPMAHGAALPHCRLPNIDRPRMVMVRAASGVHIEVPDFLAVDGATAEPTYALFFLVSPEDDPSMHLRVLAQLASHIDDDMFLAQWSAAEDEHELREVLLRDEHFMSITLRDEGPTAALAGKALKEVPLHQNCLVAMIRRGSRSFVPDGSAILETGDRLTVIGEPSGIRQAHRTYGSTEGMTDRHTLDY